MPHKLLPFLIYYFGSRVVWTLKGFEGKPSDYMSGPYGYSSKHTSSFIAGLVVMFLLFFSLFKTYEYFGNKERRELIEEFKKNSNR